MDNIISKLTALSQKLKDLEIRLDVSNKQKDLNMLEKDASKSDFWRDIKAATLVMEKISYLKKEVEAFSSLKERLQLVLDLARSEKKETGFKTDLEKETNQIAEDMKNLEFNLFLQGKYDLGNAIISVHSGQGGVEAMDWAEILLRMYLRYSEKKDWSTALLSETKGEEAGIKSADVEISGPYAYGLLKNESGTHRLVRQSPFNADRLRQTSFALVEVLPIIENTTEIEISADDLEIETFKSSGPGGQNVQKVETAVRIRHKPTGITVSTQSERSQFQNKENALKFLRAKLYKLEEEKKKLNEKNIKGEYKTASWGNQIRSYVLHPYKMVKDLRTGIETDDPLKVLDGELDPFIEAEIKLGNSDK